VNSKSLEGFLVGNRDLERLDALLDHFNIFGATGWYWGWLRGPVDAEEYRLLEGSSEMASFTISKKCGVRGDPARLSSCLHLLEWLLR
jgi:membrane protein required for beta-lactamase induction